MKTGPRKTRAKVKYKYPERAADVWVTQKMLFGVRDELKAYIKAEIHGVKSGVHGWKSDINGVKSEIHGLKSDINGVKSEIHGMKSEIHGMKSEIHRLAILIEEQNARNRIVLDGLSGLFIRQDRVESQVSEMAGFLKLK